MTNPYLPEAPADGKHIFDGSYRCLRCGVYNRRNPDNNPGFFEPCQGQWAHSGKMRAYAEERWKDELLKQQSPCTADLIFHNENTGTDGEPVIEAYVSCNLDESAGGCGFSVPFHDDAGTKHDAYDFWVTTADVRRYEALHQAHRKLD